MKKITPTLKLNAISGIASLLLINNAQAAQLWYLGSDASGNLISSSDGSTSASWTGGGSVVNNSPVNGTNGVLIEDMTSGKLGGIVLKSSSVGTFYDLDIMFTAAGAGPATADFQIVSHTTGARGFNFTNLQNVSGIRVVSTFDQPLSYNTGGSVGRRAWGFAVQNRVTDVDFNASMTLPDMITLTDAPIINSSLVEGIDFVRGTGPAGWFTSHDPTTSLAGVPAIMGLSSSGHTLSGGAVPTYMTVGDPNFSEYIGIEGIDYNGDDDSFDHDNTTDTPDEQLAKYSYLNTVDWLIESTDGSAFTSSASFNFSMDGIKYNDTIADAIAATDMVQAPEPSSALLIGLGSLSLMLRRRRI